MKMRMLLMALFSAVNLTVIAAGASPINDKACIEKGSELYVIIDEFSISSADEFDTNSWVRKHNSSIIGDDPPIMEGNHFKKQRTLLSGTSITIIGPRAGPYWVIVSGLPAPYSYAPVGCSGYALSKNEDGKYYLLKKHGRKSMLLLNRNDVLYICVIGGALFPTDCGSSLIDQ